MQLKEKFTSEVGALLKSVEYIALEDYNNQSTALKDSYKVVGKTNKELVILFCREVKIALVNGYSLKIEVELKRFAKENVDLDELITDEVIEKSISDICEPIMPYVSFLISQITSNFNRQPIITAPVYLV